LSSIWHPNCRMYLYMCLAVPGKILEATDVGISRIAKVEFGGVTRQVYLDFVPEAQPGDYVLVHVGFAISRLEEEEAQRTYELLRQLQEEMPGEDPEGPA
jgi:hydrogenase expression/formation protein HypC